VEMADALVIGAGVALAWGCARDVCSIVARA
jgi:hypothetical protein